MLCATCGEPTSSDAACTACGAPPRLDHRYRLERALGRSVHALTYAAIRIEDGVRVVAKELTLRHLPTWRALDRFHREATLLRELDHSAIPKCLEQIESGVGKQRSIWLIQTWFDGPSLEEEAQSRRYDEREVLEIVEHIAVILQYLHDRRPPIVHRDIKPSNIIRTSSRSLALVDFGAAQDQRPSVEATVSGTFGYMAPEHARGQASCASDIYSLGATALQLLTRESPDGLVDADGRPLPTALIGLSPSMRLWIARLMAPNPAHRPPDGATVVALLRGEPAPSFDLTGQPQVETVPVAMPHLGPTVDAAKITRMRAVEGEWIDSDSVCFELETDKATLAIPAPVGGVVTSIYFENGAEIRPGTVVLELAWGSTPPSQTAAPRRIDTPSASTIAHRSPWAAGLWMVGILLLSASGMLVGSCLIR
ncbi:MAG: protein kinase [Myxococcota bacterium]